MASSSTRSPSTGIPAHPRYWAEKLDVPAVTSAHDVGGMHGFGPVLREENEPVFHEAWERSVVAMFTLAGAQGLTGPGDCVRDAIERIGNIEYLTSSYYERGLAALTLLLTERGVIALDELEARLEARATCAANS